MTYDLAANSGPIIIDPEDRVLPPAGPAPRAARQRWMSVLVAAIAFHALLLIILFLRDRADANLNVQQEEIPVELVTEPPPPPPPEQKKEEKKQEKIEKPQEKPKIDFTEKPAFDAPRKANPEPEKRLTTEEKTQGPTQAAKAVTGSEEKPEKPAPSQAAAPEPADKTVSRETPEDKPDAEPLDKAAPEKAEAPQQKVKPTKERAKIPNEERAAVARQLAALSPAPNYSFASRAKVSPVDGGTEDMRYLTVIWGMILRQKHDPPGVRSRHLGAVAVVGFFLDDTGRLVHEALYRTSGYPDVDAAAIEAVRRAAPFPPPPPGTRPHLVATIEFKN